MLKWKWRSVLVRKLFEHLSSCDVQQFKDENKEKKGIAQVKKTHTHRYTRTHSPVPHTLSLINLRLPALLLVSIFPGLYLASFRAIENTLAACTSHRRFNYRPQSMFSQYCASRSFVCCTRLTICIMFWSSSPYKIFMHMRYLLT